MENEALVLPVAPNLRLVALDPAQLQQSQKQLIAWCNQKMDAVSSEITELTENVEIARKAKWSMVKPKAALRFAKGRLLFYEKIRDAVEAGYYIVPNFPCDIFAVRTDREEPPSKRYIASYEYSAVVPLTPAALLESGEGAYTSPSVMVHTTKREWKDEKGNDKHDYLKTATAFCEVDFPFVMAKPQVLDATQRAMALKIFDEMGVCPQTKKSDPLVVGIIKGPKRGYSQKRVTFLAAWFLDTDVL